MTRSLISSARWSACLLAAPLTLAGCSQRVELGGPATVVRIDGEPAGEHCESGGVAIHTGLDADQDLYLDDGEIVSTQYACSGTGPVACAGGNVLTGSVAIETAADFAQLDGVHCVDGDVLITGVDDEFPDLVDLERVTGDVIVAANPGLSSMAPFASLDAVGGVVLVQGNDTLGDLTGLGQLTQAQSIQVIGNLGLEDLSGLEGLVDFPGSIRVANNPELQSLAGLDQLIRCDGSVEIRGNRSLASAALPALDDVVLLEISGNDALAELALPALRKVEVRLIVLDNGLLEEVVVPQLTSVGDYVRLEANPVLARVDLPVLLAAGSVMAIGDPALTSISAPALVYVTQRIDLRNLSVLDQLDLGQLTSVGDAVTLIGLEQLPDLTGLASVTTIGGTLTIQNSAGPTSVAGLESLELVAGNMVIENNPDLGSLGGMAGLGSVGGDLRIVGNGSLGNAEAQAFAAGLDVGGDVVISGND